MPLNEDLVGGRADHRKIKNLGFTWKRERMNIRSGLIQHSNCAETKIAAALTEGLVGVRRDADFVLPVLGPGHFFHADDLRLAEFGVVAEVHPAVEDGEVVFVPVPQLPQVLVVEGVEREVPAKIKSDKVSCWTRKLRNQCGGVSRTRFPAFPRE